MQKTYYFAPVLAQTKDERRLAGLDFVKRYADEPSGPNEMRKDSKVKDATGAMVDNAPKNDKWRKGGSHIEVLQCGRVSKAINGQPARFHVDFRSPMSAIQAFAICLSNHGMADIKV